MARGDVAALFVDPRGPYPALVSEWYDIQRDARTYAGPWPVVAHPPCGPWGRLRHLYRGNEHDCAPRAIEQVRQFGGVLEHPAESKLWERFALPGPLDASDAFGGHTLNIFQCDWGHVARKQTWLYFVGIPIEVTRDALTLRPYRPGTPTHHVSRDARRARRNGYTLKRTSSLQNRLTPPAFAEWLIDLASKARHGLGPPQPGIGDRGFVR